MVASSASGETSNTAKGSGASSPLRGCGEGAVRVLASCGKQESVHNAFLKSIYSTKNANADRDLTWDSTARDDARNSQKMHQMARLLPLTARVLDRA